METLITLLIYVIVLGLVYYLLNVLIELLPIDATFKIIAKVIVILIIVIVLINLFFGRSGIVPVIRLRH